MVVSRDDVIVRRLAHSAWTRTRSILLYEDVDSESAVAFQVEIEFVQGLFRFLAIHSHVAITWVPFLSSPTVESDRPRRESATADIHSHKDGKLDKPKARDVKYC